ncbi:hypothetical protein CRUP_013249 [Coryphaenoides rupestris]|nr:hypothetical protein CRUP_013249 [Coryphaenoides rupestris]
MVVNTIHWFRKGLRLHDNPALQESLRGADTARCVYILDPWFAGSSNEPANQGSRMYTQRAVSAPRSDSCSAGLSWSRKPFLNQWMVFTTITQLDD